MNKCVLIILITFLNTKTCNINYDKNSLDRNFLNNVKIIMYQNTILLFVVVGFIAFYYFNKFNESEKEYIKLHGSVREMYNENQKLKLKVKELQAYKDDVSKTFKILDNELIMINDHIQRRQQPQQTSQLQTSQLQTSQLQTSQLQQAQQLQQSSFIPTNRVSLLTPELLNAVFFDIQPQRNSSTAIINTVVENIPIQTSTNSFMNVQQQRQEERQEERQEKMGLQQEYQEKLQEIQEQEIQEQEIQEQEIQEQEIQEQEIQGQEEHQGVRCMSMIEENKSLEEKLDERALEEMLKNVEMSTMNDIRLMGEESEYNNLLLDLNKFKVNNL